MKKDVKKNIKVIRSIYFEYDLFEELSKVSERLKISRSEIVNRAVRSYLNNIKITKKRS